MCWESRWRGRSYAENDSQITDMNDVILSRSGDAYRVTAVSTVAEVKNLTVSELIGMNDVILSRSGDAYRVKAGSNVAEVKNLTVSELMGL